VEPAARAPPIEPLPEGARLAVAEAREMVAARLEGLKGEYPPAGRIAMTGHAHLDLAWLWPVSETLRKGRRTFASVLSLMDRYEDFVFNQSSAQLYAWIEDEAPDLFERVRQPRGGGPLGARRRDVGRARLPDPIRASPSSGNSSTARGTSRTASGGARRSPGCPTPSASRPPCRSSCGAPA
jgi:hypothetical protein